MKELIDIKRMWDLAVKRWAQSFGCIVLMLLSLWFGMALQEKLITDDCKFVGAFRDGPQAYNCNVRAR